MTSSQVFPEQAEARRLLDAALAEGSAHAYLFHGPPGVGKRRAALGFAGALLGDPGRVERRAHPDLYVLEPLGDQIRIDAIRELRHDLHMRPFEADRRVYLVFGAHTLNEEAADALLKDLEEPPPYAVAVLVADDLGPLPDTILSRCQLVSSGGLSDATVREEIVARSPELSDNQRLRSHAWPAVDSTVSSACSTRRRLGGARPCSRSRGRSIGIRASSRETLQTCSWASPPSARRRRRSAPRPKTRSSI